MSSELQQALKRLVLEPEAARLPDQPLPQGPQASEVATGRPSSAPGRSGAIAFEESDFNLREYWPERPMVSSDGIFTVAVRPIRSIALVGGEVALFREPTSNEE